MCHFDLRGKLDLSFGPGVAAALEPKIAPRIFPKLLIVCYQWTRDVTAL